MEPKIRVKLLDKNLVPISDRLVDQAVEFNQGPKDKHNGSIMLEVTLTKQEDTDKLKAYLDQLSGTLPLGVKTKTTKKELDVNAYKEILRDIRKKPSIEKVTDYLDSLDFRFVTYQHLRELNSDGKYPYDVAHLKKSDQYMIRCSRIAVDPKNDKFDFTMIFSLGLFKRRKNITIYKKGKEYKTLKINWDKPDGFNMKEKKVPQKYPKYMTIEERKKYRGLERKHELDKPLGKYDLQFFERWKPEVDKENG
jgi:hypothetical protein